MSNVQCPIVRLRVRLWTLDFGLWTLDLKPDYPRAAIAPEVAVQRVPSINDQRRQLAHALVVDSAVIGDDYDAIGSPQRILC